MSGYKVAHFEEIEEFDDGRAPARPVRAHFGVQSFGINAWTAKKAGDRLINEHDEASDDDGQEELYLVQQGRARFELDGESVDAPAGTFVYCEPKVKRTAFAEEAGTTLIALGGTPGQAYQVSGWEYWAPLNALYRAGKYEEAADQGQALLKEHPEYPVIPYNLACCEALAGRTEDAIEHLKMAIERREAMREFAAGDSDFDSIRDEPAFKDLVGA